jgi:hypothetical protein
MFLASCDLLVQVLIDPCEIDSDGRKAGFVMFQISFSVLDKNSIQFVALRELKSESRPAPVKPSRSIVTFDGVTILSRIPVDFGFVTS